MKDIIKRYYCLCIAVFCGLLLMLGVNSAKNGTLSLLQSEEPSTFSFDEIRNSVNLTAEKLFGLVFGNKK